MRSQREGMRKAGVRGSRILWDVERTWNLEDHEKSLKASSIYIYFKKIY